MCPRAGFKLGSLPQTAQGLNGRRHFRLVEEIVAIARASRLPARQQQGKTDRKSAGISFAAFVNY